MTTERHRLSARAHAVFEAHGPARALAVRAAAAGAPAEILLYDEIGQWGVSATMFAASLTLAGKGAVTVRINSPGGDVFDGMAMYNMLLAHPGAVSIVVDGIAASAASYVAMGGSSVAMNETSMLMIHNSRCLAYGTKADMASLGDVMGKLDGQMADIYARKSGGTSARMAAYMDAETFFTSAEAKAAGLCDTVIAPPEKAKALAGAVLLHGAPQANEARRRRLRLAEAG